MIAKACQLLLLFLGIAVVVVTVETVALDEAMGVTTVAESGAQLKGSQLVTFCISLVATFVSAVQAFYNPVRRWQQVRDATSEMQSIIWQYRTRTGPFKQGAGDSPSVSTQALAEGVRRCNDAIMLSADVQETGFYQFYSSSVFKHGQRAPPPGKGKEPVDRPVQEAGSVDYTDPEAPSVQILNCADYHFAPVYPDEYVRLRILGMLRFYRTRLPRYARGKTAGQWTIMFGSVTGTLVAYLGFAPRVAIISSFTASVSAWMEFQSTAQKISRYNATILALKNLVLWWDSLNQVDKGSPVNIDKLVQMGEAMLNEERGAWMSSGSSKDDQDDDATDKTTKDKGDEKKPKAE